MRIYKTYIIIKVIFWEGFGAKNIFSGYFQSYSEQF